jgi:hypothetical protein
MTFALSTPPEPLIVPSQPPRSVDEKGKLPTYSFLPLLFAGEPKRGSY